MIGVEDIGNWLTGLGVTVPIFDGSFIQPMPDQALFVTMTGGPGTTNERTFDRISFQVRTRGPQRQNENARALAATVDDLILAVIPPTTIGGVFVNDIDRMGAPPRFASIDQAFRPEWIAAYLIQAARTVY